MSQEKWDKGKALIDLLVHQIRDSIERQPQVDRNRLEKDTGFLNHLEMTLDVIRPYLKGYYLTLNSWRSKRDLGDWKLSDKRWRRLLFDRFGNGEISDLESDNKLFGKEDPAAPVLVRASVSLA